MILIGQDAIADGILRYAQTRWLTRGHSGLRGENLFSSYTPSAKSGTKWLLLGVFQSVCSLPPDLSVDTQHDCLQSLELPILDRPRRISECRSMPGDETPELATGKEWKPAFELGTECIELR